MTIKIGTKIYQIEIGGDDLDSGDFEIYLNNIEKKEDTLDFHDDLTDEQQDEVYQKALLLANDQKAAEMDRLYDQWREERIRWKLMH